MAHRHVVIELKIVQHLPSLPYRVALERFVHHTRDCEPCAEAFDQEESSCSDFCNPEGHRLFHRVSESINEQHATGVWN